MQQIRRWALVLCLLAAVCAATTTARAADDECQHEWGNPVWTWTDDLSAANVTLTCMHCKRVATVQMPLTVTAAPATPLAIVTQPRDYVGNLGSTAVFTVEAQGDGLTYQWQVDDGGGWENSGAAGNETATLTVGEVTEARLAYRYRCIITDNHGNSVMTDEVRMILPLPSVIAYGTCGDNLTWVLDDTGTLTISGTGEMRNWKNPEDYAGDPYYGGPNGPLPTWHNYKDSIRSVQIGDGVTTIGNYAFAFCTHLTSVTIGNGVTSIGFQAFADCTGLTSVTIPEGVTSIDERVFTGCSGLTSIHVAADNLNYRSIDGVLFDKAATTLLLCPGGKNGAYTIPEGVTGIGDHAFHECKSLTSITIPNGVTTIGNYAFVFCTHLTSVIIPDGVTTIGSWAFESCCRLTSVTLPGSVTTISDGAFCGCEGLTSMTIPEGVITIGDYAFGTCTGLTSVMIPDSATTIGDGAFDSCCRLTSVTIPEGVTTIGFEAFSDCSGLTDVYYGGCSTQWSHIEIGPGNDELLNATRHYTHAYGGPVWTWGDDLTSASAAFTCANCGEVQTVAATVTVTETPPTATAEGERRFTATVEMDGQIWQDVRTQTIPILLTILAQPQDFVGAIGDTASFTVSAAGDGLTYQWQVGGGKTWKNSTASGCRTATLKPGAVTEARLAYWYRCIVKDSRGSTVTTNEVRMRLPAAPLTIIQQPTDYVGAMGSASTFTVVAEGDGLTYQWQISGGRTWKDSGATGAKTATLKPGAVTEARLAYWYRCIITDAYGNTVITNEVRMRLPAALTIVTQPADFIGALGTTATFTVEATGDGLKYQWQVNSGSGWANSGAASANYATLKPGKVTEARLTYRYRCIITDAYGGTVTTNEVRMALG